MVFLTVRSWAQLQLSTRSETIQIQIQLTRIFLPYNQRCISRFVVRDNKFYYFHTCNESRSPHSLWKYRYAHTGKDLLVCRHSCTKYETIDLCETKMSKSVKIIIFKFFFVCALSTVTNHRNNNLYKKKKFKSPNYSQFCRFSKLPPRALVLVSPRINTSLLTMTVIYTTNYFS